MALLELDDVVAGYLPGIDILNGVRLRVEPGTITGVIGPNGAGKSTLLKTVFGFVPAHAGRILFDGRPIERLPPHALKRLGMSYVPQSLNTFPQLTVQENLELGAWVFRRDGRRIGALLDRAYAAFPRLRDKRHLRATGLSGGEGRMLSVAKEMVTDPRLLLVDEPSAGLAPVLSNQLYARLLEARAQGVTVLLVDQNIAKCVEVSDYLYLLEMGRVRHEGPREAFADHLRELIRDALLGT
jgi:ABC-type branched-subunit amino acid transport system ATPase component